MSTEPSVEDFLRSVTPVAEEKEAPQSVEHEKDEKLEKNAGTPQAEDIDLKLKKSLEKIEELEKRLNDNRKNFHQKQNELAFLKRKIESTESLDQELRQSLLDGVDVSEIEEKASSHSPDGMTQAIHKNLESLKPLLGDDEFKEKVSQVQSFFDFYNHLEPKEQEKQMASLLQKYQEGQEPFMRYVVSLGKDYYDEFSPVVEHGSYRKATSYYRNKYKELEKKLEEVNQIKEELEKEGRGLGRVPNYSRTQTSKGKLSLDGVDKKSIKELSSEIENFFSSPEVQV